jgi:NAD(P)-dependent dehydrogenase (short-subunit alcohol dehydrogenase family)
MEHLADRVAVVTGGGSGIGESLALACADAGMHVAVADIEGDAAERVAEGVRARGRNAFSAATDVADRAAVEELAARTWKEFGACHLLCNNAGVLLMRSLERSSDADWEWILSVNLRGVVNGVQAFVPRLLEQGGAAHIVNTASMSGLIALPGLGVYTSSKYAVVGLSESLRVDLAPHGIGVSVLCPGGVRSRIVQSERNRPRELGGGGAAPARAKAPPGFIEASEAVDDVIEPDVVAEAVLDAVRADEPYIVTHPKWKGLVQQRFDQILAAFDAAAQR